MRWLRLLFILSIFYTLGLFTLLLIHFTNENDTTARATIAMGLGLFICWVLIGGYVQLKRRPRLITWLHNTAHRPFRTFFIGALLLALTEEAIATTMTNLGQFFGDTTGTAHITASTNYLDVISFHSVIVFVPMLLTLGLFLRRYAIHPLQAALLWGIVGLIGEFTLAGPQVFINAPFWLFVYGLMVYLPAHAFASTQRQPLHWYKRPLIIIIVTISAVTTFWIPSVLKHPSNHFTLPVEVSSSTSPR